MSERNSTTREQVPLASRIKKIGAYTAGVAFATEVGAAALGVNSVGLAVGSFTALELGAFTFMTGLVAEGLTADSESH